MISVCLAIQPRAIQSKHLDLFFSGTVRDLSYFACLKFVLSFICCYKFWLLFLGSRGLSKGEIESCIFTVHSEKSVRVQFIWLLTNVDEI